MSLPMEHRAGQGAGDVHDLDPGDHQPAQLIETGRLDLGDDVVGAGEVLGQLHTIKAAECLGDLGDLADLGLDEHVGAEHYWTTLSAWTSHTRLVWGGRLVRPRCPVGESPVVGIPP